MFVIDPTGARRGPFVDATSGHAVLVSPFHREAAMCGTCHDVSNPAFEKDENGNYLPNAFDAPSPIYSSHALMPIERTYSEWFYSAYNSPTGVYNPLLGGNKPYVATCQDCHMRDVTGKGCNDPAAPTRSDLPLHDMTGGSTWLPGLLGQLFPGQVNTAALSAGIIRARYMLQNAATLEAVQDGVQLKVKVTNESGHKLPTGYPEGRRMWLNIRLLDADSNVVYESGAYDAETGVLTHDPSMRIYEAKPGLDGVTAPLVGVDEGSSFHFVLNNKIFKDTRIPPRGFTNANFALFGGIPITRGYADGQYWDDVLYRLKPGVVTAQVNLYYQSTSKEYVEFLRDKNTTNSAGQTLYDLWNNNGKCPPELMASVTLPVTIAPAAADLDGDADVDTADLDLFRGCALGPNVPHDGTPTCTKADFDTDTDVDQADFAVMQRCLSGSGELPDPSCAG
jgi:cytochrome c553